MPNRISLTRKSALEAGPVPFAKIDDELRQHFNQPPDSLKFCSGLYNYIGIGLAVGLSFESIKFEFLDIATNPQAPADKQARALRMYAIAEWLDANFISNA